MDRINKLLAGVAIGAAALTIGYVTTQKAKAADLASGGLMDLEERVSELEATAARKGNRKVSLTVYGQVNQAILWIDSPLLPKDANERSIINNTNSQGRFGFKGEAKISPGWSAGYMLEVGTAQAGDEGAPGYALGIRHSALFLRAENVGTVWLGKTGTATDGVAEISLANVDPASTMLSLEPVSGAWLGGANLPYDGNREEVLKYVSPAVAGFTASAAWFGNKNDAWDASLRYAGEFSGIRLAGGVGYRVEDSAFIVGDKTKTVSGSASVMHVLFGLFLNGSYGKLTGLAWLGDGVLDNAKALHVQAGIEQKWLPIGKTTLFGEWAQLKNVNDTVKMYGAGAVQSIDAAAMDVYLSYRKYDGLEIGEEREKVGAQTFVVGGIIRF